MTADRVTRRELLRQAAGGCLTAGIASRARNSPLLQAAEPTGPFPLVDVHTHIASSRLSRPSAREPLPPPFDQVAQPGGARRLGEQIEREWQAAGVKHALCMPTAIISDTDPLGLGPTQEQAALISGVKLHLVGVAHPERFDREHLHHVEEVLESGRVKALKAYLGYLHHPATSIGYRPYYRLAAQYQVPVILHTGDTYSPTAKVKFAHPLQVDELAVDFPETRFVLAHFGNPWTLDAAQVAYKNQNVWIDLSAFLIGNTADFARMEQSGVLERTARRVAEAFEYVEDPDRFLFGSDWPLAPVAAYRDFVCRIVPAEHHRGVLHDNAVKLFRLV